MAGSVDIYQEEIRLAKELSLPAAYVCVVGSTLICGHGNDIDFLCLVPQALVLEHHGFQQDCEVQYESNLHSYRRNGQNIIATYSAEFFFSEVAIAHSARLIASDSFDMSDRGDRVRFHSTVRSHVLERMGAF